MFRKMALVGVMFCALIAGACERVEPGFVGIKVNFYGDDKGVDSYPAVTGMQVYNPFTTSILQYPTYVQTQEFYGNRTVRFQDKDGLQVTADVALSYSLDPMKVPAFYVKFRSEDLSTFTQTFMFNAIRSSFSDEAHVYSAEQMYGLLKEEFMGKVRKRFKESVEPYGLKIEQFDVLGSMHPPQNVVDALNNKIKATQDAQRVENELRSAQAEAAKTVARAEGDAKARLVEAQSIADANAKLNASLTDRVVQWRELQIREQEIGRWDGKLPSTVLNGNNVPIIAPK